jgi:hypothetical protein
MVGCRVTKSKLAKKKGPGAIRGFCMSCQFALARIGPDEPRVAQRQNGELIAAGPI